ncbi:hypothetical protein M0L20_25205 [Spirosoma sp. RP8]|uniref:Uncharacterized protein n=1 Tax=Spirosoma liriopis TaxID=2937440 RepID=A0ABT0HSN8_9BACT|nr:hypothetical protein [Spirosoma liriopis]MCK8495195.1 hypothetical protein [Spirosoma liriopis]
MAAVFRIGFIRQPSIAYAEHKKACPQLGAGFPFLSTSIDSSEMNQ